MENELVRRISNIVQADLLNEAEANRKSFCDKMNSIFSEADISTLTTDAISFIKALETSTSMRAIIPPEILEGLKKGVYRFNKSDGQYLAQIVNADGGGIVKNLRLEEVKHLSNPAGMNNLSLQMATQMKLAEIQEAIEDLSIQVNRKLDSIIQNQVDTITSEAESTLRKFENFKCHPELNIEIKDIIFSIDKILPLLKKDIMNRLNTIKEIESRKNNWFRKTVKKGDISEAGTNVSYIHEEMNYLQILFMLKTYITKDAKDFAEYSKYLTETFTEDIYYMLSAWEFNSRLEKSKKNEYFWVEKFPNYLNQIKSKSSELLALEEDKLWI